MFNTIDTYLPIELRIEMSLGEFLYKFKSSVSALSFPKIGITSSLIAFLQKKIKKDLLVLTDLIKTEINLYSILEDKDAINSAYLSFKKVKPHIIKFFSLIEEIDYLDSREIEQIHSNLVSAVYDLEIIFKKRAVLKQNNKTNLNILEAMYNQSSIAIAQSLKK